MPNILAHFGVQGITSRVLFREVDIKWILLGCVVSDVPWILRRVISYSVGGLNPYDLFLYASVQATFAFTLILCGFFALLSKRPRLIFVVLVFNTLLHLLLDAVEIKWGNGVHLFAPFSWDLLSFALVWPDSLAVYFLTAFGLVYSVWMLRRSALKPVGLSISPPIRILLALVLLIGYFASPLAFLQGPAAKDNNSVETLRVFEDRPGKHVSLDRCRYTKRGTGDTVRTFAGEELRVVGEQSNTSGQVSIRGVFIDSNTIKARDLHEDKGWLRDGASYIGLTICMIAWILALFGRNRNWTTK